MGDRGALDIDDDIARARGLPPRLYASPDALAAEQARVLARSWQIVAHAADVAEVGAFVTASIGVDPILVVRAAPGDGGLRAYFNVCPHRAGPVARGCGRRKQLACGYHGWTFALTGELLRAPESDGCDLAGVGLRPIAVEAWGPLVLCAIEPAAPLSEVLFGIRPPSASLVRVLARDYELQANWKIYVENYLEGYHVPIVHPRLFAELDYARYRTELARWWSRQHAPLRASPSGAETARTYRHETDDEDASYHWIFPTLMLNAYQGILQTNVVIPLGPTRTRVRFEWLAPAPIPEGDPRMRELVELSELVQEEDRSICEAVQTNLGSRGADRARYVPSREAGVHHFHRLYAEALG
jgi:choline monooxygenase